MQTTTGRRLCSGCTALYFGDEETEGEAEDE
jgi:hypothetical protein